MAGTPIAAPQPPPLLPPHSRAFPSRCRPPLSDPETPVRATPRRGRPLPAAPTPVRPFITPERHSSHRRLKGDVGATPARRFHIHTRTETPPLGQTPEDAVTSHTQSLAIPPRSMCPASDSTMPDTGQCDISIGGETCDISTGGLTPGWFEVVPSNDSQLNFRYRQLGPERVPAESFDHAVSRLRPALFLPPSARRTSRPPLVRSLRRASPRGLRLLASHPAGALPVRPGSS